MKTTIFLLRHTEYENPRHLTPGRLPGFPLSKKGEQQAQELADYFSKQSVDAVFASPILRTRQTAEIIAEKLGLSVQTDERLQEVRNIPMFEGRANKLVDDLAYSGELYSKKYLDMGMESQAEFFQRMDACLREIAQTHTGKHVIAVSHGDPMMSVWFGYRHIPFPKTFALGDWYVQKGSGFKIEFDDMLEPVKMSKFPSIP